MQQVIQSCVFKEHTHSLVKPAVPNVLWVSAVHQLMFYQLRVLLAGIQQRVKQVVLLAHLVTIAQLPLLPLHLFHVLLAISPIVMKVQYVNSALLVMSVLILQDHRNPVQLAIFLETKAQLSAKWYILSPIVMYMYVRVL